MISGVMGATTFSITTLSSTGLSIMTLSLKGLLVTLGIGDTLHNVTITPLYWVPLCAECRYVESRYAEYRISFIIMLSVIMPSVTFRLLLG